MGKEKLSVAVNIDSFEFGLPGAEKRQKYIQALLSEIRNASDYAEDYGIETVLIQGPHPFQYAKESLAQIVAELKQHFAFSPEGEITITAVPGSVTFGDLHALRQYGVNRISFDMQSFAQEELDALGRTYAPRAIEAFMRMVQLKFVFFNFDVTLGYGLPGQTLETLQYSVEQAIRFMAAHITLEPYPGAPGEALNSMYTEAVKAITPLGLAQYTPLHFARPHFAGKWNKLAHSTRPLLGFGAGAVSRVDGMVIRNTPDTQAYIDADGDPEKAILSAEPISPQDLEVRTVVDRLFNLEGIEVDSLNGDAGKRLELLCGQGLVRVTGGKVGLADAGKADWPAVYAGLIRA